MSTHLPLDLLIDHVEGLLDETTSARIEEQRSNDADLDALLKGISLFLSDHANKRETLERWLQQSAVPSLDLPKPERDEARTFFSSPFRIWLMAAAILGLVALLWVNSRPNPSTYLKEQSALHYSLPNYRSEEITPSDAALKEYAAKNYETALELLIALPPQDQDPVSMMALGMSSFHLGDHAQAIEALQSEVVQNSTLADQANWFSALASWHLKECDQANAYLNKIDIPSADQDIVKTRKMMQKSAACSQ